MLLTAENIVIPGLRIWNPALRDLRFFPSKVRTDQSATCILLKVVLIKTSVTVKYFQNSLIWSVILNASSPNCLPLTQNLKWSETTLLWIKHFQIYKSESESKIRVKYLCGHEGQRSSFPINANTKAKAKKKFWEFISLSVSTVVKPHPRFEGTCGRKSSDSARALPKEASNVPSFRVWEQLETWSKTPNYTIIVGDRIIYTTAWGKNCQGHFDPLLSTSSVWRNSIHHWRWGWNSAVNISKNQFNHCIN